MTVALPTEGVDRNPNKRAHLFGREVALPTEGVDRNQENHREEGVTMTSPSPRRAWIEIQDVVNDMRMLRVALPTEGVDRNALSDI